MSRAPDPLTCDSTQAIPNRQIETDFPCHHCGYNLRGLAEEGRCPECGEAVKVSLLAPLHLAEAYGPWVQDVRQGMKRVFMGYGTLSLLSVAGFLVPEGVASMAGVLVVVAALCLIATGGEYLGSREPYMRDDMRMARCAVQWSGWIVIIVASISIIPSVLFPILAAACFAANQMAVVLYAAALAQRTPACALARSRSHVVILLALCWAGLSLGVVLQNSYLVWPSLGLTMVITTLCMGVLLKAMPTNGRADLKPPHGCAPRHSSSTSPK